MANGERAPRRSCSVGACPDAVEDAARAALEHPAVREELGGTRR